MIVASLMLRLRYLLMSLCCDDRLGDFRCQLEVALSLFQRRICVCQNLKVAELDNKSVQKAHGPEAVGQQTETG